MTTDKLRDWIGRREECAEVITCGPVNRLAALLDHETPPWRREEVPPLGHWLYFLPQVLQSEIDEDGHPRRGGLIPPISLPRRMWAGSRVTFHAPLTFGAQLVRRSFVEDIRHKVGQSGEMVFLSLAHQIFNDDTLLIEEIQEIVFRPPANGEHTSRVTERGGSRPEGCKRELSLNVVQLFRFSALTFNSHRIHYDRRYATKAEGYPGLVVHGPFIATLLMDHFLRCRPGVLIRRFECRAKGPVFEGDPISLVLSKDGPAAMMHAFNRNNKVIMCATVECQ